LSARWRPGDSANSGNRGERGPICSAQTLASVAIAAPQSFYLCRITAIIQFGCESIAGAIRNGGAFGQMRPHANTLSVLLILITTGVALPQTPLPLNQNPALYPSNDIFAKKHVGPTGKPCVSMFGDARPQTMNPQIFDHMIVATNACSQVIKLKVCYYHSDHCIAVDMPAYSQKEAMLGIMPSMGGFRFEFREQFTPFGPN
jgi:hypothetical protein